MNAAVELPPLQGRLSPHGYDGRYRLYTVDRLPFDALPPYEEGGPAKVVLNPWGCSTESSCCDDKITLKIYRVDGSVGQPMERHPLYGTRYDTRRDADRAAYNAGVTAFFVFEKDAASYGFAGPTPQPTHPL